MKNLLFLFFMLFSFAVNAQQTQTPVIWKFDVKNHQKIPIQFIQQPSLKKDGMFLLPNQVEMAP